MSEPSDGGSGRHHQRGDAVSLHQLANDKYDAVTQTHQSLNSSGIVSLRFIKLLLSLLRQFYVELVGLVCVQALSNVLYFKLAPFSHGFQSHLSKTFSVPVFAVVSWGNFEAKILGVTGVLGCR